ncbi:MAG: Gfo/Idh/MocA family oxidoreductase [Rhodospirillaceae bacterium]|nr:MAG: Gfo/Idh/MocA family oxidoreductase [Rhodospirillaceae bacterium]
MSPVAMKPVRIGILGAARIAPWALIQPSHEVPDVAVTAVAARDVDRARRFASRHGILTVHDSYEALLADRSIDAIYNPLPNGLHGRWTIAALEAGKHVLCEKPFAANAKEAEAVATVARRTGLVTMEAFHYRYHGLTRRMLEIIASGELGAVRRIETRFCIPLPIKDIRWNLRLAGGALMDTGCYAIHLLRTLAGAEPTVRAAAAKVLSPGVDRLMRAEVDFADGRTGSITASMLSARLFSVGVRVIGADATMEVFNPIAPQFYHSLVVRSARGRRKEQVARQPSSYLAQLQAFTAAVLKGAPFPTNVDDAIANMRVIDACYAAAGLPRREPTPAP